MTKGNTHSVVRIMPNTKTGAEYEVTYSFTVEDGRIEMSGISIVGVKGSEPVYPLLYRFLPMAESGREAMLEVSNKYGIDEVDVTPVTGARWKESPEQLHVIAQLHAKARNEGLNVQEYVAHKLNRAVPTAGWYIGCARRHGYIKPYTGGPKAPKAKSR